MCLEDPMLRLTFVRKIQYWYEGLGHHDILLSSGTKACMEAIEELSRVETIQLSWEDPS
jgi:hypothetical protein